VIVKTVMVNIEAAAARRQVEVFARVALIAMVILLTVGAVKLFWPWPAEAILQFLGSQ
jgi:hypothetical protein